MNIYVVGIIIILAVVSYYVISQEITMQESVQHVNSINLKEIINEGPPDKKKEQENDFIQQEERKGKNGNVFSNAPINEPYIKPAVFKVGVIHDKIYPFSNLCNPNILYPINGLGPEYDPKNKVPADCPMARFVQAP